MILEFRIKILDEQLTINDEQNTKTFYREEKQHPKCFLYRWFPQS